MSKKVVVYIDKDEWYYAVYDTDEKARFGKKATFTKKQYKFVKKAIKDFWKAQDILEKAYDKGV